MKTYKTKYLPEKITGAKKKTNHTFKCIDVNYLEDISPGETSFLETMVLCFRDSARHYLRKIKTELGQRDYRGVMKTASALKPTGSYVGVPDLTVLVGRLEVAAHTESASEINQLISRIEKMVDTIIREIILFINQK